MKIVNKYIASLSLMIAMSAFADSSQDLQNNLANYQQVQGKFTQAIYDAHGMELQKSQGTFALSRPETSADKESAGKFRWDTKSPAAQLLIADGKKIYFYDPSLQQVTVQKQRTLQVQNSPAMLLSGEIQKISQQYNIQEQNSQQQQIFTLTPKKTTFFTNMKIVFEADKKPPTLSSMSIQDNLGQRTRITFSDLTLSASPSLFKFTPPLGTDVVNG